MADDRKDVERLADTVLVARGNAPQAAKDAIAAWWKANSDGQGFARTTCSQIVATDMSLFENPEIPGKKEARMLFEVEVTKDMCNYLGAMHGGCTCFLIDICSSITLNLLASQVAPDAIRHVSLTLNVTYHAPAVLGSKLRIVNTTVAFGKRVMTVRTEIYDITNNRMVATGMHVKMPPSMPKL